jgi:CSLREA domain-containing protein
MNMRAQQIPVCTAALLLLLPLDIVAGTVTVTNTTDHSAGSLRQAILDANAGDTVTFDIPTSDPGYDPATGVYTINLVSGPTSSGELHIDKSLTITGPGARVLTVQRNDSQFFQVFRITSGNVVMSGLNIRQGQAGGGGNISNSATLTVRDCVVADGISDAGGGINNGGTLTLERNTISGNEAADGGGIYNGGTAAIINSTITNNQGDGGGIRQAAGTLTITNCTVFGNKTASDGSGIFQAAGTANVRSCIIVGNTGGGGNEVTGDFVSQGHNVVGNGCCFAQTSDQINVTPAQANLGPLQFNGGATPTMVLFPGSVAIDAGDDSVLNAPLSLTMDQRGLPRKLGTHVDAGASEFDPPQTGTTFIVTTTDEHDDMVCGMVDCTLREAINAANTFADSNVINFAPGVHGTIVNSLVDGLLVNHPATINGPGARTLAIDGKSAARVFNVEGDPVTISGLAITQGRAPGLNETGDGTPATEADGGGVNNSGNLTLNDCTFSDNTSQGGAGIIGGGAAGKGGGIFNTATLALNRCTLNGNAATGGAGGFQGANGADALGGAIYNEGTLTLTNCTLSGNTAAGGHGGSDSGGSPGTGGNGSGGGEYNTGALTSINCTLSGNSALGATGGAGGGNFGARGSGMGGGLFQNSGSAIIRNTILSGNTVNTSHSDVAGTLNGSDHNFIGGNAQLAGLADNGGQTDTMALPGGSLAINAGNDNVAPKLDQRGYLRVSTSDIGAFEFGSQPLRITSITRPESVHILLQGAGVPGGVHSVQVSSDPDANSFAFLANTTAIPSGQVQYNDSPPAGLTRRFYRLTFP